jgi:superfamily II DNA or RNA helicase
MIELREHQNKAIQEIRQSFAAGNRKVLLAAPCGFGKTLTAAWMAKTAVENGKRVMFFADRIKLVDQTLSAFESMGIDFGVIQSNHWMQDYSKPVQIASIQTLARRKEIPHFDLGIVDECHTAYASITKQMEKWDAVKFIGLSATPYSQGLGLIWDDLIVPITTQDLVDQRFLAPVHYYGGRSVDVSAIKSKSLPTGGSDYDPDALADAIEADDALVGDIVRNWLEHGENAQTIAFCPSIKHSKYLVDKFLESGISAEHIDGYTDDARRRELYDGHDAGDFKILSCSKLLGVGYDSPQTRCLIDCRPTKSLIAYQQAAGRIMRSSPGKEYAIYLDHANNVSRHGFAESLVPGELDRKKKRFDERRQIKKKKAEELSVKDCPSCKQLMSGIKCQCGYEIKITEALESTNELLVRLKGKRKVYSTHDKSLWYSNFLRYARERGYKDGWAAHQYRQKFGVWPRQLKIDTSKSMAPEVNNWLISRQIAYSKSKWSKYIHEK